MGFSVICDPLFAALVHRGPGNYFHLVKLAAILGIYLAWLKTCWWVNKDCLKLGLPTARWGPGMLAAGVGGLILVFVLPMFWAGLLALLVLWLAPSLVYVGIRNQLVEEEDKVLTQHHLQTLMNQLLGGG